jgi:hypothetical protein
MDRAMLLEHLKVAERHIALSREPYSAPTRIISHLEHDGHHVAAEKAAALLALLLDTQALHEQDRDRIERELAKNPERPVPVQPAAADGLTAEHCHARAHQCLAAADELQVKRRDSCGC